MFFSPGETAETRSTWISRRLSGHSNCETALDECRTFDTCWPTFCQQHRPASYPRFPVEPGGFHELHATFLNESRTRGHGWSPVQEIGYLARSLFGSHES